MKITHASKNRHVIKIVILFLNIKSMQEGDNTDVYHVEILTRLSKSKLLSSVLKLGFSVDKLKSLIKRKFSCEELVKFNSSFISLMKDSSFWEGGLQFPSSNHYLFEILNSNPTISDPSLTSYEFINLPGVPSFRYNIRPSSFLLLFFLKHSTAFWEKMGVWK